jgi:hypothetical protein
MDLVAIAGKVSHVNRLLSATDGTSLGTEYKTTMRIDGRQVQIDDACTWAADGDHVAIVGRLSDGEIMPLAIRNDTSGFEGTAEVRSSYGFAALMIVLGMLLVGLIIGIFMMAWGIFLVVRVWRDRRDFAEARRMLNSIPRMSATPAA